MALPSRGKLWLLAYKFSSVFISREWGQVLELTFGGTVGFLIALHKRLFSNNYFAARRNGYGSKSTGSEGIHCCRVLVHLVAKMRKCERKSSFFSG
jgi:hypothetical protein